MHFPFLPPLFSLDVSLTLTHTIFFGLRYYHLPPSLPSPFNFSNTLSLFALSEISVKDVPNFPSTVPI